MRIRFQYLVSAAIIVVVIAIIAYVIIRPGAENHPPVPAATSQPESAPQPVSRKAEDELPDFLTAEPAAEPPPADSVDEPAPAPEPEPALIAAPEELSGSDETVLQVLSLISPQLTKWFIPDEQIRKWVLTIDLMADGRLPKRYRPLDYPMAKFAVTQEDGITVAADENFARLTPLIDAITAADPALLARYYRAWSPLLDKAYREQGKPGSFEERLLLALSRIIEVEPLVEEQAALVRPVVFYRYQDKALESATDLEKLCWRMGEDNLLSVQQFAREFRQQLDPI